MKFVDSDFVVCFTGEGAGSKIVSGWLNALDYIDEQLGNEDEYSVRGPCCELHDPDEWLHAAELQTDDTRLFFSKSEFAYCVGLMVTRITEPKYRTVV